MAYVVFIFQPWRSPWHLFFILKAYGTGRTEELGRTEAVQRYRLSGAPAPKTTHWSVYAHTQCALVSVRHGECDEHCRLTCSHWGPHATLRVNFNSYICLNLTSKDPMFRLSVLRPGYWDFSCSPDEWIRRQCLRTTGGGVPGYPLSPVSSPFSNIGHNLTRTKENCVAL